MNRSGATEKGTALMEFALAWPIVLVLVLGAWRRKSRTRTLESTRNGFVLS